MKAVVNANVIMSDHVIPNGIILLEDGIILAVGKAKDVPVPEGAEIIDAIITEGKPVDIPWEAFTYSEV